MSEIGFVGTGTIGRPMARRLVDAGHALVVHDLARDATRALEEAGAARAGSPREVAERCRTVFTSLPGPAEVEAVATGAGGLLEGARPGDVHVDLSTSSIDAVRRLAATEAKAGVSLLDAPVSGGVAGASQGTLAVMAGGEREAFERAEPLFAAFARNVFYLGESGAGTLAKLVNNLIFLCGGLVVQEGFVLAAKAGLDATRLLEVLNASSGRLYAGLAGLFFSRDFDNPMFKLAIAEKDVALAVESARALGLTLPLAEAGLGSYRRAVAQGDGERVFFSTLRALEADAGVEVSKLGG